MFVCWTEQKAKAIKLIDDRQVGGSDSYVMCAMSAGRACVCAHVFTVGSLPHAICGCGIGIVPVCLVLTILAILAIWQAKLGLDRQAAIEQKNEGVLDLTLGSSAKTQPKKSKTKKKKKKKKDGKKKLKKKPPGLVAGEAVAAMPVPEAGGPVGQ